VPQKTKVETVYMNFSEEIKDLFAELFNTGLGRAAVALNEMLRFEISLTLPVLSILSHNEFSDYIRSKASRKYVSVRQNFEGELTGTGIVTFPVISGKTLVNLLLEEDSDEGEHFNVIELDAITEVANIIINAVQNVISDMAEMEIHCLLPVPVIGNDFFSIEGLNQKNVYIVGETHFAAQEINVQGTVIMIYSYDNIEKMVQRLL